MAYTTFERSINARKQLRDRHGKWVYQGGSVKWFNGSSWGSGTVTGFDGQNVEVSTSSGGTATISRTDIEVISKKATLGKGQDWTQDDYNSKQKGTTLEVTPKGTTTKAAITKGDGDEWHETGSGKTVNPEDYEVTTVINDPDDEDTESQNIKFHDGSDSGIAEDSEYGQFLKNNGIDKSNSIPEQINTKWFKEKFGAPLDKGDNPGWLDKSTGEYDLEPGDIVFGFMKSGPLQGTGKQKFIVSGQKNEKGQHLFHHLPKVTQKNHSPGIIFNSGKKEPDNILSITSAVRPPQTSAPKPKEEKRVTVLVKDLPAAYTPKTGDLVSETEGEGYYGSAQKWHRILEDSPSKTSISGDPVYMVHKVGGPENYAPDTYGIKPQNIKSIQVTQERLDEIKNAPNSEQELETPQEATNKKSWFSPADDPGKSGDGWHASGPWGKYGAAGVMIQEQEEGKFLIIRRGAIEKATQGKWQLPGGAIEENETPYQGAARETIEELKADQAYLDTLEHKGDVIFDNGKGWQYTNIAATAPTKFDPEVDILETDLAEWKTREELQEMKENGDLLPAFANHLDDILNKFDKDEDSETKVDISEEQSEELVTPEADENQETLDQIKDNLDIPKKSVKNSKELDELPIGARIRLYNTLFQDSTYFVKTKEGKWWSESFGPVPDEPKPLELQDGVDLMIDGFLIEILPESNTSTPEAPETPDTPRVSTGPTDLAELPEGAVIKFSDSDEDKHYTKTSDGFYEASWLPEGHAQKEVTAGQVHAVAAYLGKDVQVVNENENKAPTPEPEIKEMEEAILPDDSFSKEEMDVVDSLEESPAGTQVKANDVNNHEFQKSPNGFWFDIESGVGGYSPDEIVGEYGPDVTIVPEAEEREEPSELKEASIEELYDDAGIDPSSGSIAGIEEYLNVGDKVTFEIFNSEYTATKQEDWSWVNDENGVTSFYPGELDSQSPKYIVSFTSGDTVYKNNDNSDSTSATPAAQTTTSNPGDVTTTTDGINIDSNGNQWVPDKNGAPIYNGDIVKNKKGDLGKVSFLQKGGKKVRVETPDGDTKFWNNHMVERTDEAFVPDTPKYQIQVNGDGKEYVTNDSADMIFVGDTVTSPGKAGFTGVVQGFKSNGQFVLVLDPADNKVKPRKTDKITVEESASSTNETSPAPAQESTTFNDGDEVKAGDFPKAPVGAVFYAPDTGDQFEKIGDDKWEFTPTGQSVPQAITYYDDDMESTIQYSSVGYVWGRPAPIEPKKEEPMAQWEKELLGGPIDVEDVENASMGTTIYTPSGKGGYFKKDGEDNWGFYDINTPQDTPVYDFKEQAIIDAVKSKKNGDTPYQWGLPPATPTPTPEMDPEEEAELLEQLNPEPDKVYSFSELEEAPIGSTIRISNSFNKAGKLYEKTGDDEWTGLDNTGAKETDNIVGTGSIDPESNDITWDRKPTSEMNENFTPQPGETVLPGELAKAPIGSAFSMKGSTTNVQFQKTDLNTWERFDKNTGKQLDTGNNKNPFTDSELELNVATGNMGWETAAKGPESSEPSHGLSVGDKVQTGEQLKQMKPGEFVKSSSSLTGITYNYVKQEDSTFKNPENGSTYSSEELEIGIPGNLEYGGNNYQEVPVEESSSPLKPGDKITSVEQLERMSPGDTISVALVYSGSSTDYVKQSDGKFKSDTSYGTGHLPVAFNSIISEGSATYKGKEELAPTPEPETPTSPNPGDKLTLSQLDELPTGAKFEVELSWTSKKKEYTKLPNGQFEIVDSDGDKYSYGSYAFEDAAAANKITYLGQGEEETPAPVSTPAAEVPSLPGKNGKKVSVGAQVTKESTATKPAYSGEIVDINTVSGDVTVKLPDGSKKKAKAKFLNVDQEAVAPATPTGDYVPAMYDVTPVTLPKDPDSPWYEKPMPQPPEAPPSIQQPKWAVDGLFEEISQSYTDKGKGNFADDYYKNVYDQLAINGSLSIPANFNKNEEKYGPQNDIIDFFKARDHISEEMATKAREHFENVKKEYEELQKTQEKDQADYNEALKKHLEDLTSWKMANGIPLDSFNKHSFTLSNTEEIDKLLKNQGSAATAGDKAFPSTKEAGWDPKDIKSMRTWVSGGSYSDKENPENSWDYVSWESWSKDMYQTKEAALVDPNSLSTKDHANAYKAIQEAIAKSETKEDVVATRAGEIRNFTTLGGVQLKTVADLKNMEGSVLAFYSIFAGSPGSKGKDVGGNKDLDIQVRIPKGSHAAWLAGKNDIGMSSEMEVLLPPGSKFYVHKVIPGTGGYSNRPRVIVDLVPNDWTPEFEKSKISDIDGNLVVGPGGVVQTSTDVPGTETSGPTVPPEGQETAPPSIDLPLGA